MDISTFDNNRKKWCEEFTLVHKKTLNREKIGQIQVKKENKKPIQLAKNNNKKRLYELKRVYLKLHEFVALRISSSEVR